MKSRNSKICSLGASALLTLAVALPTVADDTELLIVDPANSAKTPPNIMFILDTSGSMGDPVNTTAPYDSTRTYSSGDCDTDAIYWTKLDVEPACRSGGVDNTQYIEKSAFLCNDAKLRMSGIGAYTGIMVQYRSESGGASQWQEIAIGNTTSNVECQQDSGVHGNGGSANYYAQAAADAGQFTNDPDAEVSWGSGNAAQVYTMYDGNYLNWKENPVTVSMRKIDIVKAVNRNLMNAIEDVNVGVMRFSGNDGGRILHAISDINTNRTTILNTIAGLGASGNTPLSETLYESALYWRGLTPKFGNLQLDDDDNPTGDIDPNAFVGGVPGTYKAPAMPVCTRNFNVLLSDGLPTSDTETESLVKDLPDYDDLGRTICDGTLGNNGVCLDDVSEYLSKVDISSTTTGDQLVTTHTIGFALDIPILKEAAEQSGGSYYRADDVEGLTTALMRIVEQILDKGLAFSAPAVAVNTFNRTQNLNDLYISTFAPRGRIHWPGNLKKYTIDDGVIKDATTPTAMVAVDPGTGFFDPNSKSFWTVGTADGDDVTKGGAANQLPAPADRDIYTNYGLDNNLTLGSNAVSTSNTSLTAADFGLTGAPDEPTLAEVIRWARGEDVLDVDPTSTVRNSMGDPLHSQPAAVVYGGTAADPEVVVFTATNDGYFHAIDGKTGVELWSFIPKDLLPDLPELMLNGASTYKHYGLDGDIVPVVADLNDDGIINGSDFVYVIFGMRRGGNHFFALDVTNKESPQLLWQKTLPEFGQSWSRPVIARVDMNHGTLNSMKAVVVVGEGYDTVHDTAALPATADNVGAGITMLDLVSGEKVWRAGRSNADLTIPAMTRSIPSQVRVIDFTGDGFADRMYAVDVGGQVFRFDVFRGELPADTVTGGVIARFGGEGIATAGATDTRRFYSAPDVSIFTDPLLNRRFISIGVGSGYRAHPLDTSAPDAYFSLRDPDVFAKLDTNAYNNYPVATAANMQEVAGAVRTTVDANERGWMLTVPPGQMILSGSATFDDSVFFLGFEPNKSATTTCEVKPGKNFLYRVSISNGDPIVDNISTITAGEADAARVTTLAQGGIAPTPAFLFPSGDDGCTGADCSPPPIGCVGVECFDPGFANNPVRTLWTQDGIE